MTNGANELSQEDPWAKARTWTLWTAQAVAYGLTGAYYLLRILGRIH